jgi:exodeoxyribonuclease V alpha subunit
MEKYLGSGVAKGIGPVYAHRLVAAFGTEVFTVIDTAPERLREIPGIGPQRARTILQGWHDQRTIREIMVFLQGHGVSTTQAVRIYKTYGTDAIATVQANPYQLARDIRGIGFKSADQIAQHLGIAPTAAIRVQAGVSYALLEATNAGHCGLPAATLTQQAASLLAVSPALVDEAIAHEANAGTIISLPVRDLPCWFLSRLAYQEHAIANRLQALAQGPVPWPTIQADKALLWAETQRHITLSASQRDAIRQALIAKVLVITGGPGVGKTTLVNTLLTILTAKGMKPILCAPTGRAAKRLTETTGRSAQTIHRLLQFRPGGGCLYDASHPLTGDVIIVDECSMVDTSLMYHLLQAIPPEAALVLVGDVDQIPSVGPGQVFREILEAQTLPIVRLTEIFRQAHDSGIITNAHRINHGQIPIWNPPGTVHDFYFVTAETPEQAVDKITRLVADRIPHQFGLNPLRDIQVLCPMNRGDTGARHLNQVLQQTLNPPGSDAIERFGWHFGPGDKVMQLVNDYDKDVFNGDLGWITAIQPEDQTLTITFDDRSVLYDWADLDAIVPAYATTIHKAQGSEYPAVVIPVTTQHFMMLKRNLLYTAVTRGQRLVILVGQPKALAMAVRTQASDQRWSHLQAWLQTNPLPSWASLTASS